MYAAWYYIFELSVVSVYHNEKCLSQEGGTSPFYKVMAIVRGQIYKRLLLRIVMYTCLFVCM